MVNQNYEWWPSFGLNTLLSQQVLTVPRYIQAPQTSYFDWVMCKEFFLAPEITCPDVICSSGSLATLDVDPLASNISWQISPSQFVTTSSGTGLTANLAPVAGVSGEATITYSFDMPNGETFTAEETFWIGEPEVEYYGGHLLDFNTKTEIYDVCEGTNTFCEATHPAGEAGIDAWEWRATGGTVYPEGSINQYADVVPDPGVSFVNVELRAHNACGWSEWGLEVLNVVYCYSYYMTFSPNPSTSEATLSIESKNPEEKFDENEEWDLEVYTQSQNLKLKKQKIKGRKYKVKTQSWKEGMYIVRAKYKDKVITGRLMVK